MAKWKDIPKIKNDVYKLPTLNKSSAFRYTGKSTFTGLRSHAKQLHFIWYITPFQG